MRLLLIICAQFLSGSIWFAANAAFVSQTFLLSAVQAGFIAGTLSFAFLNLSDRFSPVRVFFACSMAGAVCNLAGVLVPSSPGMLLVSRFLCGIALAGIYPVGMKIAASWYPKTLGRALGFLVGALVLASGFPYLIKAMAWQGDPGLILGITSGLCLAGGLIQVVFVGDGPFLPKGSPFNPGVVRHLFSHPRFRASALGYFGHMWELYAVWAGVPLLLAVMAPARADMWSFIFFAAGFFGCAAGGMLSLKWGSRAVAGAALMVSALCCIFSPAILYLPLPLGLALILVWGLAVVTDSPQFSSLNARFAPSGYVGSALTIVNCIGFSITIFSIELVTFWSRHWGIETAFLVLAPGPVLGWVWLNRKIPG
jgi:MFS family permease